MDQMHHFILKCLSPQKMLPKLESLIKIDDNKAKLYCQCGYVGQCPLLNKSKNAIKGSKQFLIYMLYFHVRQKPQWMHMQWPKQHNHSLTQILSNIGPYNKEYQLQEQDYIFKLSCKVCGWNIKQTHLGSPKIKAYSRLLIFSCFTQHIHQCHLNRSLEYIVQPSRLLIKQNYLYIDVEYCNHFYCQDNTFLVHLATLTPNYKFINLYSCQAKTSRKAPQYFSFQSQPINPISYIQFKKIIINRIQQHNNKVVVKDGRLEMTFLSLLDIKMTIYVKDFGAGLIKQQPQLMLNQFKGNHLNLQKQLQFYEGQLQNMKDEFKQQVQMKVEPNNYSAQYCRMFLQKDGNKVTVSVNHFWNIKQII